MLSDLLTFQDCLVASVVVLMSSNSTVVVYINKQGSMVSLPLCLLSQQILTWLELHSLDIRVRFIPGKKNVVTDQHFHRGQVIPVEWWLHHPIFDKIC